MLGEQADRDACFEGVHPAGSCYVIFRDYRSVDGPPLRLAIALRPISGTWVYAWGNTLPLGLGRMWIEDERGPRCIVGGEYEYAHHNWDDVARATAADGTQYSFRARNDFGWVYTLEIARPGEATVTRTLSPVAERCDPVDATCSYQACDGDPAT
ncbi:MAG: hypothetical protein K8H88_25875 [Sandaracinaceae bacterium]|nr:hypothetical protein [Sandaracinaceae bacterium]